MTAIRDLLERAAPAPARELDVDALVANASRSTRRRRWRAALGALVVLAAGMVAPHELGLSVGGRTTRLETVNPPPTTVVVDAGRPRGGVRSVAAPPSGDATPRPRTATHRSTGRAPAPTRPPARPPTPAPDSTIEGCEVYSSPSRTAGPVAGAPAEEVRECEYVATVAGGYEGSGTWTLDIVRDGRTITLDSVRSPACQRGVLQPGDVVRAHLGLRSAAGGFTTFSAGGGAWHLTVGSYSFFGC